MTNEASSTSPAKASPWPRRLWAAVDGLAAWTFMMLGYLGLSFAMMCSVAEIEKRGSSASPPESFAWLVSWLPEPGWCLLLGISALALAYARMGFVEGGGLKISRLLVMALAALMLMLAVAVLPLIQLMPAPPPIVDVMDLDEVVFLLAALAVLGCCLRCTRDRAAVR